MKCLVIADDFTGSNDTGVQIKNRGLPVQVVFNPDHVNPNSSVVVDTETRHREPDVAYSEVRQMTELLLKETHYDLVYKKMDSTLRGNVAEEIKAVFDVYRPDKIIFAPAFPEIGRTTVDGIQKLNGLSLSETEFACDPLSPVKQDNIKIMMQEFCGDEVQHHRVEELEQQVFDFGNKCCHVFDGQTYDHLRILVKKGVQYQGKILWVGSAGLAQVLFDVLLPVKPTLSILGSLSEVSLNQLKYAEKKGVCIIKMTYREMMDEELISQVVEKIISRLDGNKDVILTAARSRDDYNEAIAYAKKMNVSESDCSQNIQNKLSKVARQVVDKRQVSGLFMTGGATAVSVMKALESAGVTIKAELLTGMVLSELNDGPFKKLPIITKAGAFGHEEDIVHALKKLKDVST